MRPPRPAQRFVAPRGAQPKAAVGRGPHASPTPRTALRGPIGSSTEGPSGGARMRPPRPGQ
eukprot:1742613-Pyramimonas_sp.AAC.1